MNPMRPRDRYQNPFAGVLPPAGRSSRVLREPRAAGSAPTHPPHVEDGRAFFFKPPARRIVNSYAEPDDLFLVMLSGSYFATWQHGDRQGRMHARAGDVVFWPAGTRRTEHNDPVDPMRMIKVYLLWTDRPQNLPAIAHDRQRVITALAQVMLGVENTLLPRRGEILSGYAAAIVSEYMRLTEPGGEELAAQVVRYTREHARQRFGLAELARSVGLETNYFGRRYKQLTGRTPMQDVRRVRVEQAAGILRRTSGLALKEVAARVGMGSGQMLSRWLKRQLNVTARDIRGTG